MAQTTYTVKEGDSLGKIAARHNITVAQLRAANNIPESSSLIHPRQVLQLPAPTTYIVKEGDSVGIIAQQHNITVAELKEANNIPQDSNLIHPGQKLTIPVKEGQSQPVDDKQARADSLNTVFQPEPTGSTATCPLKDKITIFPVRYAIDESPTQRATNQGPNPIPKDWLPNNPFPTLKTRSYTLRQLRDGWVYVWDKTSQELHEYKIEGQTFTLMAILDKNAKDITSKREQDAPQKGQAHKYIAYKPTAHLFLSYSEKQSTEKVKKQYCKPSSKWTRELKLAEQTTTTDHIKAISELGKYVADIQGKESQQEATFTTTTVATVAREGADQPADIKSVINETAIQGAMPKTDTGIFVALDDPLAILDDLTMSLSGRLVEINNDQYKASVANECLQMVGIECYTNYMSKEIQNDPVKKYQCMLDIENFFIELWAVKQAEDTAGINGGVALVIPLPSYKAAEKKLQTDWGITINSWDDNYTLWEQRAILRGDLKFKDMLKHLIANEEQQQRYQQHVINSENDLELWLNQLSDKIADIFLDNTDEAQSEFLLEKSNTIYTYLATTDDGREWIVNQCEKPTSVIGLVSYNFSQGLHQCTKELVDEMVTKFETTQNPKPDGITEEWLEQNIVENDNIGVLRYYVSTATSGATRANEIVSAHDMFQRSQAFQKLLEEDKQAFETQKQVVAKPENEKLVENITAKVTESIESAPIEGAEKLPDQPKPAATPVKPRGRPRTAKPVAQKATLMLRQNVIDAAQKITGKGIQLAVNQDYTWLNDAIDDYIRKLNAQIKKLDTQFKTASAADKGAIETEIYKRNLLIKRLRRARAPAFFLQWMQQNNVVNETTLRLQRQIQDAMIEAETPKPATASKAATPPIKVPTPSTPPIRPATTATAGSTAQKMNQWFDSVGGKLPVIVLGFNLVNLYYTIDNAATNGYSTSDQLNILSSGAYTANAFAALYVMPFWNAKSTIMPLGAGGKKITQFGIIEWSGAAHAETAVIAKNLANSMAVLSLLAFIGSSVELYQVYTNDYQKATSDQEKFFLQGKMATLGLMVLVSGSQFLWCAIAARIFPFAWVMSTPVGIIIAIIGVAYFLFSLWAAYEKREGVRLWLHRCCWGKNGNYWPDTLEGHKHEQYALYKELLQPTVYTKRTNQAISERISTFRVNNYFKMGIWLAIQLPAYLSGKTITLNTILVDKDSNKALQTGKLDTTEIIKHGCWVASPEVGKPVPLDHQPMQHIPDANSRYTTNDNTRVWKTWLEFNQQAIEAIGNQTIVMQLAITYPNTVLDEINVQNLGANHYIYEIEIGRSIYVNDKTPLIDYYALDQEQYKTIAIINNYGSSQNLPIAEAIIDGTKS